MNLSTLPTRGMRSFFAGSVLAVAATLAVSAWAGPRGGHDGMAFGGAQRIERMLESVNATDAQRTQITQIFAAAQSDLKARREAGKALREQQLRLFAAPTVDANAVEQLRQQQMARHDQASRRMTQAMVEASRVLSPEQRAQLAERIKSRGEMLRRHHEERRALEPRG